ncbi:unnamed protein product [Tilletia caries]|nr:unnamed protein product [Tilletia caries]
MFPFPIRHRPHSTPPTLQNRQVWQPSGGLWGQAAFTPWRPSGTGATPSIHPAQEVHTAPDTASATASTNNDDGVTPFPVFRALPREVKETFHRIMEAMSTTTCDFLQTASPSQLPEDALQRIAVQAGTTIPHPLLPEGSDFGINEACPAAEGTATLTADAGVSGVDDRFRVGLDASGVPYPDIVALLRHGNQEST